MRDPLLTEREATHGDFGTNAKISQALKGIIQPYAKDLSAVHREALDMICLKISRILSGQAGYKDHWDDIAGYAKLGAETCSAQPNLSAGETCIKHEGLQLRAEPTTSARRHYE